ncbi:hypothetical protein [Streptomyces sp. NPDC005438]|uniref:hypothetical protein n=1 Tax=Streptomyces sp. NPDC005438 TaxID=3156880 RepID=UPI0033AC73F4
MVGVLKRWGGALRTGIAALAVSLLATVLGLGTAAPAHAATPAHAPALSRAGVCPDGNGVTVVVDFRELGGGTLVRCAVGAQKNGLAALKAAGIRVTGTNRWGESFICRLENKPGADRESCVDTPPASAYWSYWHASNGGKWTYSQYGATYRTPPKGSFEGWSFSLNREQDDAPAPRMTPRRPSTPPPGGGNGGSGGGSQGGSQGGNGGQRPGDSGNDQGQDEGKRDQNPEDEESPKDGKSKDKDKKDEKKDDKKKSDADKSSDSPAPTPTEDDDWDGADGQDGEPVSSSEDQGMPLGTVVAAGTVLAVATAGGVAAWRRRRAGPSGGSS